MEFKNHMLSVNPDISIFESDDNKYVIVNEKMGTHILVGKQIINIVNIIKSDNSPQLIDMLKTKYSTSLNDEKLNSIIEKLINNGILVDENRVSISQKSSQKSHIKYQITILRANKIDIITSLFSKLFYKPILLSVLIFTFINIILIFLFPKNNFSFYAHLKFTSEFLSLIPLLLLDAFFHELGHMSALKRFKLRHGDIGFGLYLFSPTLYADVNNSWRLNMKEKIIVNLGGIYFNLIFINILVLVFYYTQHSNLLLVLFFMIFRVLFNLNPFLKTDGYWVLSDFTKTYNLRMKSKQVLSEMFFSIFKKSESNFTFKQYLLSIYALLSYFFILLYVIILFNSYTVLYFPISFCEQIIYSKNIAISFVDISKFMLTIVFYAIIVNQIFLFIQVFKNSGLKKNLKF